MKALTNKFISDPNVSEATKKRVATLQKRLEEAGIVSLHFSWNYEKLALDKPTLDSVVNNICKILEDDLDGKTEYTEVDFNEE